jgi:hypothetical protein
MRVQSIGFVFLGFVGLASVFSISSCSDTESPSPVETSTSSSSSVGSGGAGGGTGGSGGTTSANGGAGGTGGGSGGSGGSVDKAKDCVATFGAAITTPGGRIDGTVVAVLKPTDLQCPMPNSDHLIIEVKMKGDVYRMVVDVQSNRPPPDVYFMQKAAKLPAPAWSEGWHQGAPLDYVNDLKVHSTDAFTAYDITALSDLVTDKIDLGAKISVYAYTDEGGSSAHLVHKNTAGGDGAIVVDPDGSPQFLLFHFDEQTF